MQEKLLIELNKKANPKKAQWWQNYIKHDTLFLGVAMQDIRLIVNGLWDENVKDLSPQDQRLTALSFISQKYTEQKLAGILLLAEHIDLYENDTGYLIHPFRNNHLSDWGSCDWMAVKVLAPWIAKDPKRRAHLLGSWTHVDDLWTSRAPLAAMAQVCARHEPHDKVKEQVILCAKRTSLRKERFAHTAIGWALRELSSHDPASVQDFLKEHKLSPEATRMAKARLSA